MVSQALGIGRRAMGEWPNRKRRAREGHDARPSTATIQRLMLGLAAILTIAVFGRIMAYPLQHDEQLFTTAGAMLSEWSLYRDLGYNHVPNYIWLLNGLFRITATDHFLLAGRLLTFATWIAAAGALWLIGTRIAHSRAVAATAIILMAANVTLLGSPGVLATNNFAPLPLALFGFYFFHLGVESAPVRPWLIALAGLCLSLAAGFKANYLFVIPPFVVAALFVPAGLTLVRRMALVMAPLALGGIVGAIPVLYYLFTDSAGFFEHTLGYFTRLHVAHWQELDVPKVMGIAGKVQIAESIWFSGTVLLAAAGALIFVAPRIARDGGKWAPGWPIWVTLGLIAGGCAISFVPTPSFPHYYVPPIIFVILLFILAYGALPEGAARFGAPVILAIGLVALVTGGSRLGPGLLDAARPAGWTGLRIHATGREIARITGEGPNAKMATLAPLYALEGGMSVYPELAAGPFIYRVADSIPDEQRHHYRTVSETGLAAFLDKDPPAAILVGLEGPLDAAFIRHAAARGYRPVEFRGDDSPEGRLSLYVRPASHAASRINTSR